LEVIREKSGIGSRFFRAKGHKESAGGHVAESKLEAWSTYRDGVYDVSSHSQKNSVFSLTHSR